MRFYQCKDCGSILILDKAAACCGEALEELIPNTTDAAGEKHVPVAVCSGSSVSVTVGAVEHPMLEVHYIEWIARAGNLEGLSEKGPAARGEARGGLCPGRGRDPCRGIRILQSPRPVEG